MRVVFLVFLSVVLAACNTTTGQNSAPSADVQAPPQPIAATPSAFSVAQQAMNICSNSAPDWETVEANMVNAGFKLETDPFFRQRAQAAILSGPDPDVLVLIGIAQSEGACLVGVKGMTPEQTLQLAQPLVTKYAAQTNEARGQGISPDVLQAWAATKKSPRVYIAAYKNWGPFGRPIPSVRATDVLREPGRTVRFLIDAR